MASTMQTSSAMTTIPADPSMEPIRARWSKSRGTSISSAVKTAAELPPGITAFNFLSPAIPPPQS